MSTRSNIAIEDPKTKKVKVIYVHSDGYPYGVGKCLVDNYNNRQLAEELFHQGEHYEQGHDPVEQGKENLKIESVEEVDPDTERPIKKDRLGMPR